MTLSSDDGSDTLAERVFRGGASAATGGISRLRDFIPSVQGGDSLMVLKDKQMLRFRIIF